MGDVSSIAESLEELRIPDAKPVEISPHLTLQPPLSRRGRGPGLILVLDHYALLQKSEANLDPPPLQKWAEEGYAVAQVLVPGKPDEFPLSQAVEELKKLEGCEGEGFGLICMTLFLHYILPLFLQSLFFWSTFVSFAVRRRILSLRGPACNPPEFYSISFGKKS